VQIGAHRSFMRGNDVKNGVISTKKWNSRHILKTFRLPVEM